jgi:L-lactate dehydrogenase complex protein LldG
MPGSARDEILETIARALKRVARPESLRVESSRNLDQVVFEIRSKCERRRGELIEQFESELQKVGARFHRATDADSVVEHIGQIASIRQARTAIGWDAQPFNGIDLAGKLEKKGIRFITEASDDAFTRRAASADIGVSGVDHAIADTGTLVLLARTGQARSVSLLPPVHVAVVRPGQILSSLDDLFPVLRHDGKGELASAVTFITGPSRTADIELTLVVGVHGPQELHVVLLDS